MFFQEILERTLADPAQRGCMLVNSALETTSEDEIFRDIVATEFAEIRAFFYRCVVAASESGEITTVVSADDAATHLLATLIGVRVLARVNPQQALLIGAIAPVLLLLGLPALPATDNDV
jgi:TetR/AcrR family transcriptional repressor of nem operon